MKKPALHALLAISVSVSLAAAACGGNVPGPGVPGANGANGAPSTMPSGTAIPSPSASTAASSAPSAVASAAPVMKPLMATAMTGELVALGLDPKKLPPLEKLEPEKLRKVMKTFTKALGVSCEACHNADDFKAATPKKKIATHMWNDLVRGLKMTDGSPVYCDSCHQGHLEMLDHKDKKALSGWMQAEYVDKLARSDKKEHGCETCHGDPFEGAFLTKVWAKK